MNINKQTLPRNLKPIPSKSAFVQIINVAKCHWTVASNLDVHGGGYYRDVVCIYDSG